MPYLRGEDRKNYDGCLFCIKGQGKPDDPEFDQREYVITRSEHVFVALNMYPYNNGHVLVVPFAHVPSIEVLPAEALTDLMLTVNKTLAALRAVYSPQAFNIGLNIGSGAGAGIPDHVHLHIVPRWEADTGFITVTSGTRMIPDLLDDTYRQLVAAWDGV
jgi:ATP adenylyltransferase